LLLDFKVIVRFVAMPVNGFLPKDGLLAGQIDDYARDGALVEETPNAVHRVGDSPSTIASARQHPPSSAESWGELVAGAMQADLDGAYGRAEHRRNL